MSLLEILEQHQNTGAPPELSQIKELFLANATNPIHTNNLFDFASVLKDWKQLLVTPDFPAGKAGFKETYEEDLPIKYAALKKRMSAINQTLKLNQPEESRIPIFITKNNNSEPAIRVEYSTNFTLASFGSTKSLIEKTIPDNILRVDFDINLISKTRNFRFFGDMSYKIEALVNAPYDSRQDKLRIDFMIDDLNGRNPLVTVREFSNGCRTCTMAFYELTPTANKRAADIFADMATVMDEDKQFGRTDYINAVYCYIISDRLDLALKFIELVRKKNKEMLDRVCAGLKNRFKTSMTSFYDISATLANFSQPIITPHETDIKDNQIKQREIHPYVRFLDQNKTANKYQIFRNQLSEKFLINSKGDAILTTSYPIIGNGKPTGIINNPLTFNIDKTDLPNWFLAGNIQAQLSNQPLEDTSSEWPHACIQNDQIEIDDNNSSASSIVMVERRPAYTQRTVTLSGTGAHFIEEYSDTTKSEQDCKEILDKFIAEAKKAILVEKMLKLLEIQMKVQMKTALKPLLKQEKKLGNEKVNENVLKKNKRDVYAQLKQKAYDAISEQLDMARTSFINTVNVAWEEVNMLNADGVKKIINPSQETVNIVCKSLAQKVDAAISDIQKKHSVGLGKHRHTIRNMPKNFAAGWAALVTAAIISIFKPSQKLEDSALKTLKGYFKKYTRTESQKALIASRKQLIERNYKATDPATPKANSYGRLYSGSLNYLLQSKKEKEQKISLDNPVVNALCKRTRSLGT